MIFPYHKIGNDIDNLKNQKLSTSVKIVLRSGVGHRSFLRLKFNCSNQILPFPANGILSMKTKFGRQCRKHQVSNMGHMADRPVNTTKMALTANFSQYLSAPPCYSVPRLAFLILYPELSSLETGLTFPGTLVSTIQPFCLPWQLFAFWPLVLLFNVPGPPHHWLHHMAWLSHCSCLLWTLANA